MFPHLSPAFQSFIAPAQERSELWRTLLGFTLFAALYVASVVLTVITIYFVGNAIEAGLGAKLVLEIRELTTTFATSAALISIVMMIPPLWATLRFVHKRPLSSLLGPSRKIEWNLWRTAAMVILILLLVDIISSFTTYEVTRQFTLTKWLILLAPALLLLFFQTAAEELLFRGYLQQQLAARFNNPLIWWLLPSVIFGLGHYDPAVFGQNAWLIVAIITFVGLILADVTARFGSLSPAMGMHFINNAAMLLVSSKGDLSGLSLYTSEVDLHSSETGTGMMIYLGVMLTCYLIFMLIMRRRRL